MASTSSRQNGGAGEAALIPLGSHAGSPPIPIKRPATLFGSRKDAVRIHLESSTVSKVHCVIVKNDWGCYIHDLGSRTHTVVNGKPVVDADLKDGDQIQIGRFQFKFQFAPSANDEQLIAPPGELKVSTLTDPLPLSKRVLVIGRRENADLHLEDKAVSNIHAIVFEHNGTRQVRDMASRTGTWVDGKPIHQELLTPGAAVKIGPVTLAYALALPHAAPTADLRDDSSAPIALADSISAVAEAPIDIDAPAKGAISEADLDDLLDLDIEEKKPAAPAVPPKKVAEAPKPAPIPTPIPVPPPVAKAPEPPKAEPPRPEPIELEPAAELDLDLDVDEEPDGQPSEDGLASLRREWRGAAKESVEVTDEQDAEAPAITPLELEPATPEVPADEVAEEAPAEVEEEELIAEVPAMPEIDLDDLEVPAVEAEATSEEEDEIEVASAVPVDEPAADETVAEETDDTDSVLELEPLPLEDEAELEAEIVAETPPPAIADLEDAPAEPVAIEPPPVPAKPLVVEESEEDAAIAERGPVEATEEPAVAEPSLDLEAVDLSTPVDEPEPIVAAKADEATADIELELDLDAVDPELPVIADDAEAEAVEEAKPAPAAEAESGPEPEPELDLDSLDLEPLAAEEALTVEAATKAEAERDDIVEPELDIDAIDLETPEIEAKDEVEADALTDEPELDLSALAVDASEGAEDEDAESSATAAEQLDAAVAVPEIDLSAAKFDEIVDDADEEPTPIAELESIDFTSLDLGKAETTEAKAKAHDDQDTLIGEIHDESETARPLMHLADSVTGMTAAADFESEETEPPAIIDEDIEVIGETQPMPESAQLDLDLDLDVESEIDEPIAKADEPVEEEEEVAFDAVDLSDLDNEPTDDETTVSPAMADVAETDDIESLVEDETEEAPVAQADRHSVERDASGVPIARAMDTVAAPADAEADEDADLDIAPPKGGTLSDLIPADGPLIGGSFASPPPSMLIGGSPVVVPDEEDRAATPPRPAAEAPKPVERRKPLRVGFAGGAQPQGNPFASGTERTIADAFIGGRRGTASVDVFANPSPTPEDLLLEQSEKHKDRPAPAAEAPASDVAKDEKVEQEGPAPTDLDAPVPPSAELTPDELAGQELTREEREIMELAKQFRPRGQIRPVTQFPQHQQQPQAIPPFYRPGDDPESHAAARRRRIGRVFICLALMATLIPGALLAIHTQMPASARIDALVSFTGLDAQGEEAARQFRARQNDVLTSETTRQDAVTLLPKGIPYGFLDGTDLIQKKLDKDLVKRWPAEQPSQMKLTMRSEGDKENDLARLRALTQALVNASQGDRTKRDKLQQDVEQNTRAQQALKLKLDDIDGELLKLRELTRKQVSAEQLKALDLDYKQAEDELRAVKSHRQELEATIDRLQREALAPATAPAAAVDVAKADAELSKLNEQLAELQKQNNAVKSAVDEKASAARKQLDAVIAQFDADLQTAQKLKDNPELQQYVEAVNRQFKQTRELTEQLIRRQETQRTRLSELKQRLSDKITARTKDLLEKDGELKRLNDSLAMAQRQLNAANAEGAGTPEEKAKLEGDIQLTRTLIGAREDLYKNDPIYNEAIGGLQEMVDKTEQFIKDDRKQVDEMLAKAQEDFTKSAPAVEKLPAEQKALAEALDKKLAAVNEARKAYDATSDSAQAEQAKIELVIKEKMTGLEVEIASRKSALTAAAQQQQIEAADTERKLKITQAQTQLATIQQQEAKSQVKLDEKAKAVQDAVATNDAWRFSDTKRGELDLARADLDSKIKRITYALRDSQNEMAQLIVPDAKFELVPYDIADQRPMLMTAIGGGLFALLLLPLCWNLVLLSRDAHHATAAIPIGGGTLATLNNGSGHANGHDNHDSAINGTHDDTPAVRMGGFDPLFPDETASEEVMPIEETSETDEVAESPEPAHRD